MPHDMTAEQILARFSRAKSQRGQWEGHWQEVADLCLPTRDFVTDYNSGQRRRNRIFNDTASEAVESLAAALDGLLTNTAIRWFSLVPDDPELAEDEEAQAWLYDAGSRMMSYFDSTRSGFAMATHECYLDLVAFGTAVCLVRQTPDRLLFQSRQLPNFYLIETESGDPNEMYRKFSMTAMECYERWGEAVSDECKKMALDNTKSDKKVDLLHYVYRRFERAHGKQDGPNKAWGSVYMETKKKHILSVGGFDQSPYLMPRWSRAPEETYGRSPAMKVLPSIKVINAMARTQLEAGELSVRPPLMMPANSIEGPIRTAPGSIMYVRSGAREFPRPLETGARPDFAQALIESREARIEKAFFLDTLKLPDRDRMTATEIIQRRQEGLLLASPVLSRLYAEWLNPIITRTFAWMQETGRLPEMPAVLSGGGLSISYLSPLALSKRASESQAFTQAMNVATPLIQVDPSVMANLDADAAFRAIMTQNNVNPVFMRSSAEVAEGRAAEAQQAEQQQMMEQAQGGASATRDAAAAMKDIMGAQDVGI